MTTKRTPFAAGERRVPEDPGVRRERTREEGSKRALALPAIGGSRTLEEAERLALAGADETPAVAGTGKAPAGAGGTEDDGT